MNFTESSKTKKPINHIPTPSSATISALSREVQSKMMQQISSSSTTVSNKSQDDASSTTAAAATIMEDIPQFASSMEASQASQQSIHDWDRKMGLRRAHSKTMRGKRDCSIEKYIECICTFQSYSENISHYFCLPCLF